MPAGYRASLVNSQVDGTALTNSTTPTSILPGQSKFTLAANYIQTIGTDIEFRAAGRISTVVTTPGTLTFDLKFGSVIVATSGALALNVVAKVNVTWELVWRLTARAVGGSTTATLMHTGRWASEAVIGSPLPSVGGSGILLIPASAPAVGTGFDSTAAQQVDLFATWSVANASNSILVHQAMLESLNG